MKKEILIKNPVIENKIWETTKAKILELKIENKKNFENISELINELLTKYNRKEIKFENYLKEKEIKKPNKITLTKETLKIYNRIPKGGRSYIISGLLRTWLKEQN